MLSIDPTCKVLHRHLPNSLLLYTALLLSFVLLVALLQLLLPYVPSPSLYIPTKLVLYSNELLVTAAAILEPLCVRKQEDLVCKHKLLLVELIDPAFVQLPNIQLNKLECILIQDLIYVLLLLSLLAPVVYILEQVDNVMQGVHLCTICVLQTEALDVVLLLVLLLVPV